MMRKLSKTDKVYDRIMRRNEAKRREELMTRCNACHLRAAIKAYGRVHTRMSGRTLLLRTRSRWTALIQYETDPYTHTCETSNGDTKSEESNPEEESEREGPHVHDDRPVV